MMKFGEQKSIHVPQDLYPVVYSDNVLDKTAIDEIEKLANQSKFNAASIGQQNNSSLDLNVRRSEIAWIQPENTPKQILEFFEKLILSINEKHYEFHLTGIESMQFTVYDGDFAGEYKWHIDTMRLPENLVRKMSISILLSSNEEFDGGHLLVSPSGQTIVAEQRQGRAVFFPSWVPHCVTPVTRGVRKSLVIWAHGPMFK